MPTPVYVARLLLLGQYEMIELHEGQKIGASDLNIVGFTTAHIGSGFVQ